MVTDTDGMSARWRVGLEAIPPRERSIDGDRLRQTHSFRGLTLERAIGYLENLGGRRVGPREVVGDGWRAELSTREVPVGPSYRLTEVTVTWIGDEAVLEPIIFRFRVKAFRAPG